MSRKELLKLRDADLKKRFNHLTRKENKSVDFTLSTLEKEFYLNSNTIWLIVTATGFYKKQ